MKLVLIHTVNRSDTPYLQVIARFARWSYRRTTESKSLLRFLASSSGARHRTAERRPRLGRQAAGGCAKGQGGGIWSPRIVWLDQCLPGAPSVNRTHGLFNFGLEDTETY